MKVSFEAFCAARRLLAERTGTLVLSQYRFVAADFDGEDRVWAVVDDAVVIADMRQRITERSPIFLNGQPVLCTYDPILRPLLVVHSVT